MRSANGNLVLNFEMTVDFLIPNAFGCFLNAIAIFVLSAASPLSLSHGGPSGLLRALRFVPSISCKQSRLTRCKR